MSLVTQRSRLKILLMGHEGHGKNTVCQLLQKNYGLSYQIASIYYAKNIIQPKLAEKYGYKNELLCWLDRHNHREEWFQLIKEYNLAHTFRTGSKIWSEFNIYSGLLDIQEYKFLRARKMFDVSIWVDASERVPSETKSTITVETYHGEHLIRNHSTRSALSRSVDGLMEKLTL